MNCSNNIACKTGTTAALCAAAFLMSMSSCTEVDDRLGANLVPKNQRMEIEVTSPENGVQTFLYREDSIPASRTGRAYFGRHTDPTGVFGAQTSSALLQFLPASVPYADADGYGLDPIVDSMVIFLSVDDTRGDTTVVQKFDVWEIAAEQELLNRDTTYYTNFPIEKYKKRRLFEFSHKGRGNVSARLFPTEAGKEYLNSIVNMEDWDNYLNDTLFHEKFQGLYITPAEDSPTAASLFGADLTASGLELHVRNHDSLDVSAIYDTLYTVFSFQDKDEGMQGATVAWNNVSVNIPKFDYTGSLLGALETETNGFTDTLATSTPLSTVYIQSMGGVGTFLRFTDDLVEEIRNLKFKIDEEGNRVGKDIAINQAMMKIWLSDSSIASLDSSMERIGSYLNMKSLAPIPDYQYATEMNENLKRLTEAQQYGTTYSPYLLPYNGSLNRSNSYYELDITSYIQQLSKVKEDDPDYMYISPGIYLAPEAYGIFGSGESILKGLGSDQPVSIRITYTIIEG
jgi:hypothetical protein